ncbi:MAG: CRISPR-associated protein Csx16 [Burkholderiales bacterium]|jgi:CRISPR-associated protein Csx16
MPTYFVTRHEGARFWARHFAAKGLLPEPVHHVVEHLDPSQLQRGDVVMGTLPIHLVAELHRRGVRYWSLDMTIPLELRGKDLSGTQMVALGATLTQYQVKTVQQLNLAAARLRPRSAEERPPLMVSVVGQELMPVLIGCGVLPTAEVLLLVTEEMKPKAAQLKRLLQRDFSFEGAPVKVSTRELPVYGFAETVAFAQQLFEERLARGHRQLWLNLTNGTKPMALALSQAATTGALAVRLQPFYIDAARRQVDPMRVGERPRPLRAVANVRQRLEAAGLQVMGAAQASPTLAQQLARRELVELLTQASASVLIPQLNQFAIEAEALLQAQQVGSTPPPSLRLLSLDSEPAQGRFILRQQAAPQRVLSNALRRELGRALHAAGVLRSPVETLPSGEQVLLLRHRSELRFLQGGWLEIYLGQLLEDAGVDDWALGVEVRRERAVNELDLVAACGNQLLLIEAKTGLQQRADKKLAGSRVAEGALYKFEAVSNQLAREFRDRWYVSAQPLDPADLERARQLGIRVFMGLEATAKRPNHHEHPSHPNTVESLAELPAALQDWVREHHLNAAPSLRPSQWDRAPKDWQEADTRKPFASI